MTARPHAHASLDGLVLGDAFGDRWFLPSDEPAEELWAARDARPAPWHWTDDSAMALVLFAHLTVHGEVRQDRLATDFAAEYARDPGRKYGPSMHGVLERFGRGEDWRTVTTAQFGGQGSHGNGAAMRVAPLGAWFRDDLAAAAEQARLSALTTHAHPEAVAGAVAVSVAAALAAAGADHAVVARAEFLREVASHVPESDVRSRLVVAAGFPGRTSVRHAASVLGSGTLLSAQDTVPFALWAAAGSPDDLAAALWLTVGGWGDRDTTCAIAGGVVAARTGTGGVPASWLRAREEIPVRYGWDADLAAGYGQGSAPAATGRRGTLGA
ncbi:ADP-ribosylglycohydrolase family protein [Streptomyces sp. NPDC086023]|uniref:ADP-ribosylglycohydrolase family protein n=1 Tax=Streptomyces sp. NPDC086023 TaxID=3365746 RepID=UPI0037D5C09B